MSFTTKEVTDLFEGKHLTITDHVIELYDGARMHIATRVDWQVDAWELTPKGEAIVNGTPMPKTQMEEHRDRALKGLQDGPQSEAEKPAKRSK